MGSDESNTFAGLEEHVFAGDYGCGSRIQLVATVEQPYAHGEVECSMDMISTDGRMDTDGHVIVSGDIEVTFQCFNPPTRMPSVSPSAAPVVRPTVAPAVLSESPTVVPTMLPSIHPTTQPSVAPTQSFTYVGCFVDDAVRDL